MTELNEMEQLMDDVYLRNVELPRLQTENQLLRGFMETQGYEMVDQGEHGVIFREKTEFNPDWKLSLRDQVAVALTLSLSKNIPGWPGATDEQIAAVASDVVLALKSEVGTEANSSAKSEAE